MLELKYHSGDWFSLVGIAVLQERLYLVVHEGELYTQRFTTRRVEDSEKQGVHGQGVLTLKDEPIDIQLQRIVVVVGVWQMVQWLLHRCPTVVS